MKYLLITPLLFLLSCDSSNQPSTPNLRGELPNHKDNIKIEQLSNQFDQGLYTIVIDDTTKVLFYRGVESCTMIQIK